MFSRRDLLRLLAIPAIGSEDRVYGARYRARATVLMLSVPLLHRDNVGGAYLRVRQRDEGGKRHWRFEFGAGSLPERAAGLNRLGVFEETIVEAEERIESASYFGFMTVSNEKNLDQARSALRSGGGGSYTAIRGRIERGTIWNRLLRISDLAATGWDAREQLTAQIRTRLADGPTELTPASFPGEGDSCGTFLHAVHSAMRLDSGSCARRFIHNGKIHRLLTARKASGARNVVEIEGRIQSDAGQELSSFRLWFEADAPDRYPLRFEFRPRSFLRLTFERV